jgi:hypothetical protein
MRKNLLCSAIILQFLFTTIIAQCQLQKIYLQPKAAGTGKQAQFVDSIRFIPLEVKDGIQTGSYDYVLVTEKYFLIANNYDKSILLYSKNGAFIKKISYKKLGQGFYPNYDEHTERLVFLGANKNYSLTPKDQLKIKLDWDNSRNKKYFKKYTIDLKDSSFTMKKEVPDESDIIQAYHFYDDVYWQGEIITSPLFKDSLDYEFKLYKNNKLVKGYFPYNRIKEPRFLYSNAYASASSTVNPYIHFVTRPFCDTIYKVNRDSLFPAYQLVLPLENSLPASFFTVPFKNKTEGENFGRNNGWVFRQVNNFYETEKFIFFGVRYMMNYESYVYQKQTNIILKAKNIKPDSSQYNLQLLAEQNALRKGDRFYRTKKAGDLLSFFEQNKNVPVPKELEDFLKSNPPATTPVIVEFKLKS